MCDIEEFEIDQLESQEPEAEKEESAMATAKEIEAETEDEEDTRREFDSKVPVTI